ncbi:MAG: hypothetical protein JW751_27000 [Polyangiaceae bacterium]|nr:hypothetical protein [Polyangiaceae bacterium]
MLGAPAIRSHRGSDPLHAFRTFLGSVALVAGCSGWAGDGADARDDADGSALEGAADANANGTAPPPGTVLGSIPAPENARYLTYDGRHLWTVDLDRVAHRIDPETGEETPAFGLPNHWHPIGLEHDGRYLFVLDDGAGTDRANRYLRHVLPATGELFATALIERDCAPRCEYFHGLARGVAWDTNLLYFAELGGRIGFVRESPASPGEEALPTAADVEFVTSLNDLAYDGWDLWAVTDRRVLRIRQPTPGFVTEELEVPVATRFVGIARSGYDLWILGADARIYRVRAPFYGMRGYQGPTNTSPSEPSGTRSVTPALTPPAWIRGAWTNEPGYASYLFSPWGVGRLEVDAPAGPAGGFAALVDLFATSGDPFDHFAEAVNDDHEYRLECVDDDHCAGYVQTFVRVRADEMLGYIEAERGSSNLVYDVFRRVVTDPDVAD